MEWLYFLIAVAALVINIIFCVKFKNCAEEKGHNGNAYFWVCFFFGPIGYILVAALPDINAKYLVCELSEKVDKLERSRKVSVPAHSNNTNSYDRFSNDSLPNL